MKKKGLVRVCEEEEEDESIRECIPPAPAKHMTAY